LTNSLFLHSRLQLTPQRLWTRKASTPWPRRPLPPFLPPCPECSTCPRVS
jgi:hypothetical protein